MKAKKAMPKDLQRKLLGTVVEFMARSGVSDAAIEESFRCGLKKSRELRSGLGPDYTDGSYLQNGDVSADLLRAWHRESKFISDVDAAPRPLQLLKGKNSIRSIILSLHKKADVDSVIEFLKDARLIRKTSDGRYLPTAEAGTITQNDSFVVEHLVKSVTRLFNTMRRNTSAAGRSDPLIERYAYVSDLNPRDRKSFSEFTRLQGMAYLQAVDDWMEQRRVGRMRSLDRKGARGVVAGVQVVAYLGDEPQEGRSAGAEIAKRAKTARRRISTTSPPATPA